MQTMVRSEGQDFYQGGRSGAPPLCGGNDTPINSNLKPAKERDAEMHRLLPTVK